MAKQVPKQFIYKVQIKTANKEARNELANYLHLDEVYEDRVVVYVRETGFEMIKLNNDTKNFKVLEKRTLETIREDLKNERAEFPSGDEEFHTYDEVIAKLKKVAVENPTLVKLINIGSTHENRDLLGLKITAGGFDNELEKPAMMLMGSHHAREHLSTEVPVLLIDYFIEQLKTSQSFKTLMENRVVYVVPLINPDGALYDIKGRKYQMWRKNRRDNKNSKHWGVDLNRNYGFGWGTGGSSKLTSSDVYMGEEPFSEPETQAVKKFVEAHKNIQTMITFHTFSELILYPWGGKNDGVGGKEQKVFETLARKMASWNKYKPEQSSDLYIASGDTCDWAFGKHNIFCFTFELSPKQSLWTGSAGFYPGAKAIQKTFKANIEPVLYLLRNTENPYGVLPNTK
jgi:carboxypeptidase T